MADTPMQKQYSEMKQGNPDALLLFRLGDFYECFYADAEQAAKVLGITLTGRGKDENRIPMAGIPYHALPNYLPKLLQAGIKVAIAEQVTPPGQARLATGQGKLVERKIVKIYTPGTITDERSLQSNENNYLASVFVNKQKVWGVCFTDLSTGSLNYFEHPKAQVVSSELNRLQVKEIICASSQLQQVNEQISGLASGRQDDSYNSGFKLAIDQFGTTSLKGFGLDESSPAVNALGGLLAYVADCQRTDLHHLKTLKHYSLNSFMPLDAATIRNLELINFGSEPSLLQVLDKCATPMGRRLLRDYVLHPLIEKSKIEARLESVEVLSQNFMSTDQIRSKLAGVYDLERIAGRIGLSTANARDLVYLAKTLETIKQVSLTELPKSELLEQIFAELNLPADVDELVELIGKAINSEPPLTITEGNIIKSSYHAEVLELRELTQNSKQIIAEIQQREIKRTGISTLKVGFNNVSGYYLEVTKSQVDKVPSDFIRKQTLANAERYITEELKVLETKILSAEGKLNQLEYELFCEIRAKVTKVLPTLQQIAQAVATLDILANFAFVARQNNYVKPEITESKLEIVAGRHPVIEQLPKVSFVANDTKLNTKEKIVILTGPNMSGKSTYIRQVALITLMAQIGSFVPAEEMKFELVDRIFTRVGAHDNLSKGESTFMVEMNETANILNNATSKSLIILDEIGRGTSTYDGVAIAWSIVEFIQKSLSARTLFATHYHELIKLSQLEGVVNYRVKVSEQDGRIEFTHQIEAGSTDRSYGVHVAELAGIPKVVVDRAEEILKGFEQGGNESKTKPAKPKKIAPEQIGLGW